jgi:hypothetical protein
MGVNFVMDLQLFGGGKGGGSTTNVQSYQPTPEERRMMNQSANYAEAVAPNALELNNYAMNLLKDSLGTVQVDYNTMNQNAQNQIANAMGNMAALAGSNNAATTAANNALGDIGNQTGTLAGVVSEGYGNLAAGNVPSAYQSAMGKSIASALDNTIGKTMNSLGNRGVINSSVTNEALNDIQKNAANTVAQQYQQNINQSADLLGRQENTLGSALQNQAQYAQQQFENTQNSNSQNSGIYSNLINGASTPITTAAGAQEAAISPAQSLWSSSLGLNGATTSALAGLSGKGTTTTTQTMPSQGSGGFFSGLLSAGINAFCFPAGTKILMADGTEKNIEDIVSGDEVTTDSGDTAIVLNVMEPHYNEVYEVVCEKGKVRTTATQPLMMADGKNYVFAGDLSEGIELRRMGKVQDVHYVDRLKVYDFETTDDNQYIANGFVAMGGNGEIWGC